MPALEFAVIGAELAGTATVRELLRDHPDLWLPGSLELPIFSHTHLYARGVERLLRRHAPPAGRRRLRGTVVPGYMQGWHDTTTATVAARMARAFPEIKLVAILRDPFERARAQHRAMRARGKDSRSFDQAVRESITRDGVAEGRFLPDDTNAYVAQGEYGRILGEYLRHFPRASLHVELSDTLRENPAGLRGRLLRFLGVAERPGGAVRGAPSVADGEPIADGLRDELARHYAADAEVLRELTGIDVPWRGEPPPRRAVVYTAIAGGGDTLEEPEVADHGCDYVCLTDNPYTRSEVWETRPLERLDGAARRARALPQRYVPGYERAAWVDARGRLDGGPAPEQGASLTRRQAASLRREIESAHTVGLSFPKAGRSWVCYFLARYVAERTRAPLDLDLVLAGGEMPPVRFVHEHMDLYAHAPAPPRLLHEDALTRRRILVLARDPRDSLISNWHHRRIREQRPVPRRLELFADCPVYGIERISQGTALLLDLYDRHPGDKLLVTYEALVADPSRCLSEILAFALDGRTMDERSRDAALAASRFDRMRDWERRLTAEDARIRTDNRFGSLNGGRADGDFKVRRGAAGGYASEMSAELQRHVAALPHTGALLARLGLPVEPSCAGGPRAVT